MDSFPDFDILTGGFPCQAFSTNGQKMGFNDTRGTLFFEIARIAREKRPQILFLENVKGLLNHDSGRTFTTILNTLYELGYDVEWQVINGKYFVPQNRERVFIIGHLREKDRQKIFPILENDKLVKEKITSSGEHLMAIPFYVANQGANGRRMKTNNEPTFTIDTQNNNGVYDGYHYRRFTPLECERLMGFPDNWTEGVSDTQRYKILGNSVIPQITEMISKQFAH
jgi:DNA (cytosine-5)-methyltransferase 1